MSAPENTRPEPDRELQDIADYVVDFKPSQQALDAARSSLMDTIACALDALDYPECTKLLGPVVHGTIVPHGARVPGTAYQLDPAKAAFDFGAMIRWLDLNDTFTAAQGSHPSDNLGGVLMLADHLSRYRSARGDAPLQMGDVLHYLVKAYEIQGCIAIENDFQNCAIDHPTLTRVAGSAVLTHMLGGTREEIVNAVSNAWVDCSLAVVRHAPNTGWRKSWAAADANFNAVRLALMVRAGEMGYPSVLTAKRYGFYEARFGGKAFKFQRPYGDYVIQSSMFKFVAAGMHGQSAVECALRLHPLVRDRIADIARIEVRSQRALMGIMDKTGPLQNPADRDHCAQYVIAVGLIFGRLDARDFEDALASDPRVDRLRAKTIITEDPAYSEGFYDSQRRTSANAVQVFFDDGTHTPKVEVEYPAGHPRRRAEFMPTLRNKVRSSLTRRYVPKRQAEIQALYDDPQRLDATAVDRFVDMLCP
ncbi:MAG: bifunctional 2-methylcitrate dehydratase/aconitate hydratase [Betaproteobacteria bacterium]|nr:bifunctional 2-methylcitrate dehydratase/aconitate hydratase [Betaproteobacteria bacterium]